MRSQIGKVKAKKISEFSVGFFYSSGETCVIFLHEVKYLLMVQGSGPTDNVHQSLVTGFPVGNILVGEFYVPAFLFHYLVDVFLHVLVTSWITKRYLITPPC